MKSLKIRILFIASFATLIHQDESFAKTVEFKPEYIEIKSDKYKEIDKIKSCDAPNKNYKIGKYEVSNLEYAEFLNSVARTSDPKKLYSELSHDHFWGGIKRTKSQKSDEFTYLIKDGYELMPATFISWMDAARYINWLHYGRPNTGKSELGTTEGNSLLGAYNTINGIPKSRNLSAKYFLPTCGEWYVAAFFDPKKNIYLEYSGSAAAPKSGNENSPHRSANFYHNEWANKFPHLTEINKYKNNPSSFGTLNQSGNAMEWTETSIGNYKIVLGGSLFLPLDTIRNNYWDSEDAHKKISSFGFRVGKIINQNEENNDFKGNTYIQQTNASSAKKPIQENLDEWKKIDHAGNISDYKTGRGCVPYEFEIQATEITNRQYVEFLNSVANSHDKYKLFNKDMSDGVVGGIDRFSKGSEYVYSPKENYENRPVTYLSWSSLARYANWLHFGKPKGEQKIGVTEGTDSIGSYNTIEIENFLIKNPLSTERNHLKRNIGAKYFIPNDDEWYKAAYFDPSRNSLNKYWDYPNQSNSKPPNSKNNPNSINYQNDLLGEGHPFFVNAAGEFRGSSYFKILDMGGNAWEWIEEWYSLGNENCWRCNTPKKGLRGGSFNYNEIGLSRTNIDPGNLSDHYFSYGGRLARFASKKSGWCAPYDTRISSAKHLNNVINRFLK